MKKLVNRLEFICLVALQIIEELQLKILGERRRL